MSELKNEEVGTRLQSWKFLGKRLQSCAPLGLKSHSLIEMRPAELEDELKELLLGLPQAEEACERPLKSIREVQSMCVRPEELSLLAEEVKLQEDGGNHSKKDGKRNEKAGEKQETHKNTKTNPRTRMQNIRKDVNDSCQRLWHKLLATTSQQLLTSTRINDKSQRLLSTTWKNLTQHNAT